jgi:hypothetical protein
MADVIPFRPKQRPPDYGPVDFVDTPEYWAALIVEWAVARVAKRAERGTVVAFPTGDGQPEAVAMPPSVPAGP